MYDYLSFLIHVKDYEMTFNAYFGHADYLDDLFGASLVYMRKSMHGFFLVHVQHIFLSLIQRHTSLHMVLGYRLRWWHEVSTMQIL